MRSSSPRPALTLIEVLVVIAIIGALIAMLIPAVQKVRESASRAACGNNLKQLGLAFHSYHDANGGFPPVATVTPNVQGWGVYLLPHLEQESLFQRYNWSKDCFDPANAPVVATQLAVMTCPSARKNRTQQGTVQGVSWTSAAGDYLALMGVDPGLWALGIIVSRPDYSGVLQYDEIAHMQNVTDGTSNTIMLVEDVGRPERWEMGRLVPGQSSGGAGWADYDNRAMLEGYDPSDGQALGSCGINCTNDNAIYSFHPGGAQTLFADGSVHLLPHSLSIEILASLVTRAGGEPRPAGAY